MCVERRFRFEKFSFRLFARTNIETNGGDGRDDLTELELVQDSGLAGSVKAYHEDTHFLLAEAFEHLLYAHNRKHFVSTLYS